MNKKGFTLLEILIVIGIIGILAGVVLVSVNFARSSAKEKKALAFAGQVERALMADCVAVWDLDSTSAIDRCAGKTGTTTNATLVDGVDDKKALQFDGDGSVVLSELKELGDSWSMSAWVKPASLSGTNYVWYGTRGSSRGHKYVYVRQQDTNLRVRLYTGYRHPYHSAMYNNVFSEANKWYHIAVSYNGALSESERLSVYVNGELLTASSRHVSGRVVSLPSFGGQYIGVQHYHGHDSYGFHGVIDNVRVYSEPIKK